MWWPHYRPHSLLNSVQVCSFRCELFRGVLLRIFWPYRRVYTSPSHVCRSNCRPVADLTIEVCNRELLNISCDGGQVILVEAALYGRMRVGRCVRRSLGYVECQADVLEHLEVLCSGRQQCTHRMPDDTVYATQPCPPDVTSYLEVTYRCLNGNDSTYVVAEKARL